MPDLQTLIADQEAVLQFLKTLAGGPSGVHSNTLLPPYAVNGVATIFGLNWDTTDDEGDEDSHGVALKGAWGDDTHNKEIIGCAIPIKILKAMFDGHHEKPKATVEVFSQVTQRSIKGVVICDKGPSKRVRRPIDLTYGAHVALGHIEYGVKKHGSFENFPAGFPVTFWIEDAEGRALEVKAWDFQHGCVI